MAVVARAGEPVDQLAKSEMVHWCRANLKPYASVEDDTLAFRSMLFQQADDRLLMGATLAEDRLIADLIDVVDHGDDAVSVAISAGVLQAVFETRCDPPA